jgi:hypothetical protein
MADGFSLEGVTHVSKQSPSGTGALGLAAVRWLSELPEKLRPHETATRFPHIANMLCTRWSTPMACRVYFEELLLDGRGDRKGFPPPVARELAALKDYYESVVFPTQQTAWDEVVSHSRG